MTPRVDRAARHIAAEPATSYAAWVDAEALAQWLPPEGARMTVENFVPEPGGALVFVLHFDEATGKTSARTDRVQGRFLELDPPSHLAISVDFDSDAPRFAGTMRMDWTFRADGLGTEVLVEARDVPTGISPEAHQLGLQSSLSNLARYIERT